MSRFFKSAAFPILIVIVLAFFASKLIASGDQTKSPGYSGFLTQLQDGKVDTVTLKTKDLSAEVVLKGVDHKRYEVDFMAVASYGSSTESSGVVRILKDLDAPLEGRHVLIVADIVDSGLTLQYLLRTLQARGPASLEVCALLTKPSRRTGDLPVRYTGFEIPDKFAIGYGLDYAERYRNLPYVAALVLSDD